MRSDLARRLVLCVVVLLVGSYSPLKAGCDSTNPNHPGGCNGWCWIFSGYGCMSVTITDPAYPNQPYTACACDKPLPPIVITLPPVPAGIGDGSIDITIPR